MLLYIHQIILLTTTVNKNACFFLAELESFCNKLTKSRTPKSALSFGLNTLKLTLRKSKGCFWMQTCVPVFWKTILSERAHNKYKLVFLVLAFIGVKYKQTHWAPTPLYSKHFFLHKAKAVAKVVCSRSPYSCAYNQLWCGYIPVTFNPCVRCAQRFMTFPLLLGHNLALALRCVVVTDAGRKDDVRR